MINLKYSVQLDEWLLIDSNKKLLDWAKDKRTILMKAKALCKSREEKLKVYSVLGKVLYTVVKFKE